MHVRISKAKYMDQKVGQEMVSIIRIYELPEVGLNKSTFKD